MAVILLGPFLLCVWVSTIGAGDRVWCRYLAVSSDRVTLLGLLKVGPKHLFIRVRGAVTNTGCVYTVDAEQTEQPSISTCCPQPGHGEVMGVGEERERNREMTHTDGHLPKYAGCGWRESAGIPSAEAFAACIASGSTTRNTSLRSPPTPPPTHTHFPRAPP